jgi:hypothetical protein
VLYQRMDRNPMRASHRKPVTWLNKLPPQFDALNIAVDIKTDHEKE